MASSRHPPPPANICVEKGRIEFVKSPVVTAATTTTSAVRPQSPLQASSSIPSATKMGTKIFRPNTATAAAAVRKSPEGSVSSKLPPVSSRESKIPVVTRTVAVATTPKPPDVVMRIPRTMPAPPSVTTRSRETSPAGEGRQTVSPNLIRWRAKLSSSSSSFSSPTSSTAKTKATATQQQQQQQQQQVSFRNIFISLFLSYFFLN